MTDRLPVLYIGSCWRKDETAGKQGVVSRTLTHNIEEQS